MTAEEINCDKNATSSTCEGASERAGARLQRHGPSAIATPPTVRTSHIDTSVTVAHKLQHTAEENMPQSEHTEISLCVHQHINVEHPTETRAERGDDRTSEASPLV
jgi:hypothetical protein